MAERGATNPFNAKTILWVIAAGLIAFTGFAILTAYAPKWNRNGNGGTNVLSRSAVGFSGLYDLAALTRRPVAISETKDSWQRNGLMIATISAETDLATLRDMVAARANTADSVTLYILPKWIAMPLPARRGFVQSIGTLDPKDLGPIAMTLGPVHVELSKQSTGTRIRGVADLEMEKVDVIAPRALRTLGGDVFPILVDAANKTILGRIDGKDNSHAYILADPDLLSNKSLKTIAGAATALQIVDALRADDQDSVAFDGVLAGLGNTRNLLQLMFEPPFLAFTLALIAAALLIGLHALGRFGPPAIEGRAIPFGKRALADNIALLISRAKREGRLGDRYVNVIRDAAGAALGAGALAPEDLERWLGKLPGGFTDLAYAARNAPDAASMQGAAAALYQWKKDVTRDHR